MIPDNLFDEVLVVSLPESTDRRDYIRTQFTQLGIVDYNFFDASNAESSEVEALYEGNKVASYPPCFRCGKLECGRSDCNNALTRQQVAVFATYLRLWRDIADKGGRFLVCEDDILFHAWAGNVLRQLGERISAGEFHFSGERPSLLRLGWALSNDHDGQAPFRIDKTIKMSNPCHGITAAYARELLGAFGGVKHTADVYQHRLAPVSMTAAWTIFPPIASELSWSTGTLASLIHPKENHAKWLESQGRKDEAARYREKIAKHFGEIAHKSTS